MAKIKLKLGESEIEIDSRDFYVDNHSLSETIENVSKLLQEEQAKLIKNNKETASNQSSFSNQYGLDCLDDAEIFEPEFNEPKFIGTHEIKSKLHILETSGFFNSPRNVAETVQQLREYGWAASTLEVSKTLAKMASNKEINKNSQENRTQYFLETSLVSS